MNQVYVGTMNGRLVSKPMVPGGDRAIAEVRLIPMCPTVDIEIPDFGRMALSTEAVPALINALIETLIECRVEEVKEQWDQDVASRG